MPQEPIIVLIHYRAKANKADEALKELSSLVATVVAEEKACLGIDLYRSADDPTRIMLYEKWIDRESYLGDHMRTPHIQSFVQRAGEFFTEPPDISFWERPAPP